MTVAHTGDCRAILGTTSSEGELEVTALTLDHKPDDPEEQRRIESYGGYVRPEQTEPYYNPSRVFANRSQPQLGPGLSMARSLGDLTADLCGVIPTPTVSHRHLLPTDQFIVLASDGVWEFLENEDVAAIVMGFRSRGESASTAARFIIAKAAMAWKLEEEDYRDDITAIVIYLSPELPCLS